VRKPAQNNVTRVRYWLVVTRVDISEPVVRGDCGIVYPCCFFVAAVAADAEESGMLGASILVEQSFEKVSLPC
jgi:hypothetical protein